jgi:cyclopropane-fatty-acyl-phospholipid synthase
MDARFKRLVHAFEKRYNTLFAEGGTTFALQLAGHPARVLGRGEPAATLVVNDPHGIAALSTLDTLRIGEAYLAGSLDVIGDLSRLLALRDLFTDRHPLRFLYRFVRPVLFGQLKSDRAFIADHYDTDPEFYLAFLDRRHRCYSQAVFSHDDESLEDAMTRKLEFALESIGAKAGDRVLDIGGGWGAFVEFAGKRGIRVTSLTISEPSRAFIQALIDREQLPCEVRLEHFFEHRPAEPYDAVVNLGVTEHLPDYPATVQRYHDLLKPGGRVYLDASAARVRNDLSSFFERYIFRGNGTPLHLPGYVDAVTRSPLQLLTVIDDRNNYRLTTKHWAEGLDRHRDAVEKRWGRAQYRRFQIYLWGCVDGFRRDELQAYRLVMARA